MCNFHRNNKYAPEMLKSFSEIDKFLINKLKIKKSPTLKHYRFIIGESPYPNDKNLIIPSKLCGSIYSRKNVPEIAFFSEKYTVDMFMLCGILFGSLDKASQFIQWAVETKNIDYFADYLFEQKKIVVLNRYEDINKTQIRRNTISSFLEEYNPQQILIIGKETNKDVLGLFKNVSYRIICHCSARPTIKISEEWCATYLCRIENKNETLALKDFMI